MRKLIVTENITLDGVIDMAGGWFAPHPDGPDDVGDLLDAQREHMSRADAVLLGRKTYQQFESFWPHQADDKTGVSDYLNTTEKYVVSGTLRDPTWQNTVVLPGPLPDDLRSLRESAGADIVATGSIQLVQELVRTGLVDEYRLFVYPVVAGSGARLFPSGVALPGLAVAEARPFRSGVVLLRYVQQRG
jgi:dihydrofolate reductase